jgi:hypothetical protein
MPDESRTHNGPNRIPEQKQISPEMEAKLLEHALAKEQFYRRLIVFRKLGIALMVVGLPLMIFFYVNGYDRDREKVASSSIESGEPAADLEFLLKNGSTSQLANYSSRLEKEAKNGLLPQQLEALKGRLRIANELIRRDADAESVRFGILTKINTLCLLAVFDRNYSKASRQNCSDLLAVSEQYSNDEDGLIKYTANLGKFAAQIHFYLLDSTDEEFAKLESSLENYVASLAAAKNMDGDSATRDVANLIALVSRSKNEMHQQKFDALLAGGLDNAEEEVLRNLGDEIRDKLVIGRVDYGEIRSLIGIPDPQSIERLEELVAAIAREPNLSVSTYYNVATLVECLRQTNQLQLEDRLMTQLRKSAGNIPNEHKRKQVLQFFEGYEIRKSLIGKSFEFDGDIGDDPPRSTVILFFSFSHSLSGDWVAELASLDKREPLKNRYLVVCQDRAIGGDFQKQMKEAFPNGILIGPSKKDFYLTQCPISQTPYIIILDRSHCVTAINVDIAQVRILLAKMNESLDE